MSLQQISISNPSDWGKSDSFDFKLQSNNTKHQNLRKRFTKFFFQRWTIIKYRHIGIFYNHLGGKKTHGVDSHKLCPIFLHKKHITIYCNLIYHSHQKNPKHLTYDAKPKCPFTSCCVHETRWKWQHDHWKLNLINF